MIIKGKVVLISPVNETISPAVMVFAGKNAEKRAAKYIADKMKKPENSHIEFDSAIVEIDIEE
jgi:hypothetical protein